MKNLAKEKMLKHQKLLGTFFELGTATAIECLGLAGLDFVVIDTEHGPFDVESTIDFIRAAELHQMTPFVRVKDGKRPSILKMLDIGAKGIIIPCVENVAQVKEIIKAGKYYPLGERGVAPSRGSGFWFDNDATHGLDTYFKISNDQTLLIPQCETKGCLEHIEEIVALHGVDGIFVGPYDLSVALGQPGQFDHPAMVEGIARILNACKAANKFSLIYTGNVEASQKFLQMGFDGVAHNMDAVLYTEAFRSVKHALHDYLS